MVGRGERRRRRFICVFAGAERRLRPAGLAEPDFAFHHHVGRPADQKQVLDIVPAHQDKPAMAVDGGSVHDGKPRLAVAPAGDEGSEGQAADQPDDHQHDHEQDEGRESPYDRGGEFRAAQAFEPIGHRVPRCRDERGELPAGIAFAASFSLPDLSETLRIFRAARQ